MWRRLIRSKGFVLLIFTVILSLGVLGQVDTRMHIGGSDWNLDSLIYINVDEYILDGLAYQHTEGQPLTTQETQATLQTKNPVDGVTGVASSSLLASLPESTPEIVSAQKLPVTEELIEVVVEELAVEALDELQLAQEVKEKSLESPARVEATPPAPEPPKVEERKEEKRPAILVHRVNSGETLSDIASAYGVTVDTILSANNLSNPNMLSVGQELQILSVSGVLHQVASGESLWEISERYKISMDEIAKANDIADPSRIQPNSRLVIPGATQLRARDTIIVNGQLQKAFEWPVSGRISSPFGPRWGRMHNGLDIAVPTGTAVKAAADGRVTFAGWNGGYGILVIIDHGNNIETRYAHNSRLNVKVGQTVSRGSVVAYSGNTGVSTGPHVHFEIRQRNNPVNPQTYLK